MSLPDNNRLDLGIKKNVFHFLLSQKLYPKDRFKNLFMDDIFNDVFEEFISGKKKNKDKDDSLVL